MIVRRLRLFDNRAIIEIFVSKRVELPGSKGRLHNSELHNLCCLQCIVIRLIKSGRMGWVGRGRHREDKKCEQNFIVLDK